MTRRSLAFPEQRQASIAVASELRRLAERHEALARELFARGGYWRADPEAVEHSAAARVLRADADALERQDSAVVDQ